MKTIIELLKNHKVSDKTIFRLYIVFSIFMAAGGLSLSCYLIILFTRNWMPTLL